MTAGRSFRALCAGIALVLTGACGGAPAPPQPNFHAEGYPERLSDWGVVVAEDGALRLGEGVTPYALATPLFTDYAQKLRTVWLPPGTSADYRPDDVFDFPVGTIITKTFYYPQSADGVVSEGPGPGLIDGALPIGGVRLVETRVLARRAGGWVAIPYVWDGDGSDAALKRTGAVIALTLSKPSGERLAFPYVVPNQNQCAGCHAPNNTTRALSPIGPKARHLNHPSPYHSGVNQLDLWRATGLLTVDDDAARAAPRNARYDDPTESLDARARAYLDANCSHCHNAAGPADTSGLDLEPHAAGPALGLCKAAIAAGDGAGGRPYDIVPGAPEQSILLFRLETTNPAAMMPELGRSLSHSEGVALIREWIAAMEGGCA